jgi:hypothetical protein
VGDDRRSRRCRVRVAFSGSDRAAQWPASRVISAQKGEHRELARTRCDIELGRVRSAERPRTIHGESLLGGAAWWKSVRACRTAIQSNAAGRYSRTVRELWNGRTIR